MSSLLQYFKRTNETSPKEYLIELKINYAVELLDNSRLSIDEIALNSGFSDSRHFSREFRKLTGTAPSKYRQTEKKLFRNINKQSLPIIF